MQLFFLLSLLLPAPSAYKQPDPIPIVIFNDSLDVDTQEYILLKPPEHVTLDEIPEKAKVKIVHLRDDQPVVTMKVKNYPTVVELSQLKFNKDDQLMISIESGNKKRWVYLVTISNPY